MSDLVFELVTWSRSGDAYRAWYREADGEVVFEREDDGTIEMVVAAKVARTRQGDCARRD